MNEELRPVTVLYTMPKSVYLAMPGVDCWDELRDARKWPGGTPVVAHPPCRTFGTMRHLSASHPEDLDLASHAVEAVKREGGVLEHPAMSKIWDIFDLPRPGRRSGDGFTMSLPQWYWGHDALKPTWFFIVGVPGHLLPDVPMRLGYVTHQIAGCRKKSGKRQMSSRRRAATPPTLAKWLVAVARLAQPQ